MEIEKIEAMAEAEMASRQDLNFREPGWIYYHGKRTGRIARHLIHSLGLCVCPNTVYVADLFHDIGKGQDRHNGAGVERYRELLTGLASAETLDGICDAIQSHNQRKKSDSFSDRTKLVQDADLIDHVGAIVIYDLNKGEVER
jgi:HD superfamily phosphodiesterase